MLLFDVLKQKAPADLWPGCCPGYHLFTTKRSYPSSGKSPMAPQNPDPWSFVCSWGFPTLHAD